MAIFRDFESGGRDRSAEDRRRHRQLVEESIKKNVGSIIAEESIIGKSRDKIIKIPVRGIKEYQFVYGANQPGVAEGRGREKRGDRIGQPGGNEPGRGDQAGSAEGDDYYETEVTLEELEIDEEIGHFLFRKEDLCYQRTEEEPRPDSNAVVIDMTLWIKFCQKDTEIRLYLVDYS